MLAKLLLVRIVESRDPDRIDELSIVGNADLDHVDDELALLRGKPFAAATPPKASLDRQVERGRTHPASKAR